MLIYVIRHGETAYNEEGRLQGRVDMPLNKKGRDLAIITGEALSDVAFDYAVSSPLKRAYETADLFLSVNKNPVPEICVDDRLIELDWGVWDGLGCTSLNFEIPDKDRYNVFFTDPWNYNPAENGETIPEVVARTGEFFNDLVGMEEFKDKTVLISTHGCAGRALMCSFFGDHDDYWRGSVPQNCSMTIVKVDENGIHVEDLDKIYYDPELAVNPYTKED